MPTEREAGRSLRLMSSCPGASKPGWAALALKQERWPVRLSFKLAKLLVWVSTPLALALRAKGGHHASNTIGTSCIFVCFGIVAGRFSTDLPRQAAAVNDNACRRTSARPSRRSP